jgi:hypothetical protein
MLTNVAETYSTPDAIGFAEGIALLGLEEKPLRISYAVQRKHFKRIPFGKKEVKVTCAGFVTITWCAGYDNTSWDSVTKHISEI